jgi:hypothetical protein
VLPCAAGFLPGRGSASADIRAYTGIGHREDAKDVKNAAGVRSFSVLRFFVVKSSPGVSASMIDGAGISPYYSMVVEVP